MISREEMEDVTQSVFDLMGREENLLEDFLVTQRVADLFQVGGHCYTKEWSSLNARTTTTLNFELTVHNRMPFRQWILTVMER